jgi:hypothetical protein
MKRMENKAQDPAAIINKSSQSDNSDASHTELQLEREKIQIERERLALERDRLAAEREWNKAEHTWRERAEKGVRVSVGTLIFVSIICLLSGGMFGMMGTNYRQEKRQTARRQEYVQALTGKTNENSSARGTLLLQSLQAQGGQGGILLILD